MILKIREITYPGFHSIMQIADMDCEVGEMSWGSRISSRVNNST